MKVLHLYYDIMNLYGDYANCEAVKRLLESNDIPCQIDKMGLGDNVDLDEYDFIFMGSATEKNQEVALKDFVRFSRQLKNYISKGKVALFSGNSFEILGKSITDINAQTHQGLNLYDFEAVYGKRVSEDIIVKADFLEKPVFGYRNKCAKIQNIITPLFNKVLYQRSNFDCIEVEGMRDKNLFCTHLIGPVLVRNPHFLQYICELVVDKKLSTECLKFNYQSYETAYTEFGKTVNLEG